MMTQIPCTGWPCQLSAQAMVQLMRKANSSPAITREELDVEVAGTSVSLTTTVHALNCNGPSESRPQRVLLKKQRHLWVS